MDKLVVLVIMLCAVAALMVLTAIYVCAALCVVCGLMRLSADDLRAATPRRVTPAPSGSFAILGW